MEESKITETTLGDSAYERAELINEFKSLITAKFYEAFTSSVNSKAFDYEDNILIKKIKKVDFDSDLANISIGPSGINEDPIIRSQTIYGQLLDLDETYATIECLKDIKRRIYQSKKIRRDVLEGVVPLVPGQLIIIQIKDKKGQHIIEYIDGNNITPEEYFDSSNYFKGAYTNKAAK